MDIADVRTELSRRNAIIVHCSRPGRDGELGPAKPIYPQDLKDTIRDLTQGGVREISCSVVWPEHQTTFGAVGIVVEPRTLSEIKYIHPTDAGHSEEFGGLGSAPSKAALKDTFEKSHGHNEWVLTGADVIGIFVNLTDQLEVARRIPVPNDIPEILRGPSDEMIFAMPITIKELKSEFPDFAIMAYVDGTLAEICP